MYYSPDPMLAAAAKTSTAPPAGNPQSIPVPGSQKPGYSPVYRHWRNASGPLVSTIDPKITTMFEVFESSCRKYPNNNCLGWREQNKESGTWGPYMWLDYQTVHQRMINLGSGLVNLFESAGHFGRQYPVGLWAQNRPEWQITDLACMSQSLYSVSIYDTLGPETAEYIINHAELVCVVASLNHVSTLFSIKDKCPTLKYIISLDALESGEPPGFTKKSLLNGWANEKGVQVYSLAELELLGQKNPRPPVPPKPEDTITINYTSGTTGFPKGVLLTHANCISACSSAMCTNMHQTCYDVMLSYLPLAHIYARIAENTAMWGGAAIGYFHGNILEVLDDIKTLRPTTFISVPRMFNKIANAIKASTIEQPGLKGALSRHVLSTKLENIRTTNSNKHLLYDRIWSSKVKAAIGFDRCRGMVSGSAPISPDVLQTLRAVFSNDFIEGYGLTESYAVVFGQLVGDNSAGNCGPPAVTVECRLRDVPEMGYLSTDRPYPRGELLVRGNTIFKGYYKSPEQTSEVLDADGWFATGDVCHVDEVGRFSIIDRVKNLLKLAQGEYVSPEKVENQYLANFPLLATGLVTGDSFKTFLVAIFGVDRLQFAPFASAVLNKTLSSTDDAALTEACANKAVRKAVLREMDRVAIQAKLTGFEKVKNVHLCLDPFTIENELMTPTLKLKRVPAVKKYKTVIEALYAESEAENPTKAML